MQTDFEGIAKCLRLVPTHLGRFGEGLGDPAVSSSVAGGDEVRHAAAFQEGVGAHLAFAEQLGKGDHFHQTQSDHRRLGVVAKAEAIAESGTYRHDILTHNIWLVTVANEEQLRTLRRTRRLHTFRAPHSSTVSLSSTTVMRKSGV